MLYRFRTWRNKERHVYYIIMPQYDTFRFSIIHFFLALRRRIYIFINICRIKKTYLTNPPIGLHNASHPFYSMILTNICI